MNIENERKLFNKYWHENNLPFDDNVFKEYSWRAWQASANREGFVLVPVEPSDSIKDAMCGYECNTDDEILGCYKSIIEASQENKDE